MSAKNERAKSETQLRELERAQQEKEKEAKQLAAASEKLQAEVGTLKTKLVDVTRRLNEHEERLAALQADRINTMQKQQRLAELHKKSQKGLSQVLGVFIRRAEWPPGAMVFSRESPSDIIAVNLGAQAILKELNRRVGVEREQLAALKELEEKLRVQQAAVAEAEGSIAADRRELAALVKKREAARQRTDADRVASEEAAKALAAKASDLRELIQQLRIREAAERERRRLAKSPTPKRRRSPAVLSVAGAARLPVSGQVLSAFGEADNAGNRARGITVLTPSGVVVSAPREGQVVFAGPFRSYGQVVIIEVAEGAHILLTGIGKIDVAEGESVKAGEPVGRMPAGESRLYLETRKDGDPVDPATFGLTQSSQKTSAQKTPGGI